MDHVNDRAERRSSGSGGATLRYRVEGNSGGPAPPAPGIVGTSAPPGPGPTVPLPRPPPETWAPPYPGPPPGPQPPGGAAPDPPPGATRSRRRRRLRRLIKALVTITLLQLAAILSLNWFTPPTTAFMLQNDAESVVQETVGVEHVSRNFLAAVLIHEDDQLPYRFLAFDFEEFWQRMTAYLRGEPDASGSTIPQQVVKNLFLTPEQDGVRKGFEAALSMELSVLVSDARILELYVNYAQFGPNLYGVCAASWYYFDTPPDTIELAQAAQLVGLLPSPLHVRRGPDGGLNFDVPDGSGVLSAKHVWRAEEQVPYWFERTGGWQPVWDLGIDGYAQDQPDAGNDCSEMPDEVAQLIDAQP